MVKNQTNKSIRFMLIGAVASLALVAPRCLADDAIKEFMKNYHKAPKGVDPVCKKAGAGQASKDELKKLVEGYKHMAGAKAPKGDEASWKEKTAKLLAAAEALQKGDADGPSKYKEAVNCKACHSAHKPD